MTDIDNIPMKSEIQYSFLKEKEEDKEIKIDYDALINLPAKDFSVEISDEDEKNEVTFYCRNCKKFVDVKRIPSPSKKRKKVQFSCNECHKKTVFYGTRRGVNAYFHLV